MTTRSHHPRSFCSSNTIKVSHLNLSYTHLSAIHHPATPYNSTYNFYPLYFTSFGQLPTTPSAKQRPLTYFTLPNTLLTGPTTSLTTFGPSPLQYSHHAPFLYYKKRFPTPNRRIASSQNSSHTLTDYKYSPSLNHSLPSPQTFPTTTTTT